jgi:PEP-CTERM motif
MHWRNSICVHLILGAVCCGGGLARAEIFTQTFDTDASAAADGWVDFRNEADSIGGVLGANNYGQQPTNHIAGATGGEAGGAIMERIRSRNLTASGNKPIFPFYADTTIGAGNVHETFDTNATFSVTGLMRMDSITSFDGAYEFGFEDFDNRIPENIPSFGSTLYLNGQGITMGIIDDSSSTTTYRAFVRFGSEVGSFVTLDVGTDYKFDLNYVPDIANSQGTSTLEIRDALSDALVGTSAMLSNLGAGTVGWTIDGLGFTQLNQTTGSTNALGTGANAFGAADTQFFIDNLTYSAQPAVPGDLNGDNDVNLDDYGVIKTNWLQTVTPSIGNGDLNFDSVVDLADFVLFKADYLTFNPGGSAADIPVPVPEPATLVLLAAALPVWFFVRRRRSK